MRSCVRCYIFLMKESTRTATVLQARRNKFAAAYDGQSTLTMEVAQKMARTPSLWSCWMRRERFEILGLGVKSLKELWRGRC